MRIDWSPGAKRDFVDGWVWLDARSPQAADRFARDIDLAVARLAARPEMGRRSNVDGLRIMSLVKWSRRIVYRIDTGAILIVSLKHTRQAEAP